MWVSRPAVEGPHARRRQREAGQGTFGAPDRPVVALVMAVDGWQRRGHEAERRSV
jgi:hypothetical protein